MPIRPRSRPNLRTSARAPRPILRRDSVRIPRGIALLLRAGHPWIFRDALAGRSLALPAGSVVDLIDPEGSFLGRALFDPEGPIALRIATRREGEKIDPAYLEARLQEAWTARQRLIDLEQISAYRLFAGESEGLPGVTVDRYGAFLVVQYFTAAALHFAGPLYDVLEQVVKPDGIYEQRRLESLSGQGPREAAELVRGKRAPIEVEVNEGKARFLVDLTAPGNVGLFCDLREGRYAAGEMARGRRVLNLFSYTGAFTVHAALGGAEEIVSVDLAAKVHARARRNLQVSGLDPETGKQYFADEVMAALAKLAERKRRFDLIVCDPPSFSQAHGRVFRALGDWTELAQGLLTVLEPGGILMACSSATKLGIADLERALGQGASAAKSRLLVTKRIGLPPDHPVAAGFPEGHYLKCVVALRGKTT